MHVRLVENFVEFLGTLMKNMAYVSRETFKHHLEGYLELNACTDLLRN